MWFQQVGEVASAKGITPTALILISWLALDQTLSVCENKHIT